VSAVLEWLVAPLQFDFMLRALLVAVVAGGVCAVLSCWLTLIGWSLLGDAVAHSVLPGVVLSYIIGIPFAIGAFVFGVGAVGLIGVVRRTSRVKEDAAIGVVFTGLFALGIVLVSRTPSDTDLTHILFGNLLGVSDSDILQVLVVSAVALAVVLVKRRDLTLFAFDPTHAHAIGLSPRRLEATLLGLLALTVVIALQAVGIVLVVAMLIIPGATAYLLTDRFGTMLGLASAVAISSSVLGTYLSFHIDLSTGGTIVVSEAVLFSLAYLFGPRGVLRGRAARRRVAAAQR
jgi:manganese transport system permease protein